MVSPSSTSMETVFPVSVLTNSCIPPRRDRMELMEVVDGHDVKAGLVKEVAAVAVRSERSTAVVFIVGYLCRLWKCVVLL